MRKYPQTTTESEIKFKSIKTNWFHILVIPIHIPFPYIMIRKAKTIYARLTTIPSLLFLSFLTIPLSFVYTTINPPKNIKHYEIDTGASIDLKQLKGDFRLRSNADFFQVKQMEQHELINDLEGDYYTIELINPSNKIPLTFQKGKYTIEESTSVFKTALLDFNNKILQRAQRLGGKIFIQGNADILDENFNSDFTEMDCNGEQTRTVEYHTKRFFSIGNKFNRNTTNYNIPSKFGNSDLPFLRAKFLQCKMRKLFPGVPSEIIEGSIDKSINEASRNGLFILYLP